MASEKMTKSFLDPIAFQKPDKEIMKFIEEGTGEEGIMGPKRAEVLFLDGFT